ncbi:MAG: Mrp/NBP35 family ATP-binding protein [Desulfobacterales bacterium]|jgi:Mrp family chromosome partitioning ATPase|nr:Mrp/NBP35 family ATP-binding protein [Desulfobacterales bacterium]
MTTIQKGVGISEKVPEPDPDELARQSLKKIKHKFIVMSGKGGVGKTSVSVNIAIALAKRGFKVGLMDVDVHGPDIPRMLGLKGMLGASEDRKILPIQFSENLGAVSIESLMLNKDDAIIWRGPVKHSAIRQFIGEVDWGNLDFMIIDSPPGTGDEPLTVAQLIKDAKAIIVTTPQEVALADVRKSINFCKTVKMEIFGLIENMSGYTCPHCGKAVDIFGAGGGERTAIMSSIAFLGKIPFDPTMVKSSDAGISFQDSYPESPITRAYEQIAENITKRCA